MKKFILFLIIFFPIISCYKKTTTIIHDPQIYNDSLMLAFYKVQYPLDTLIAELHFFKLKFENNPNLIINIQELDTNNLLETYRRIHKNINKSKERIEKIEYFKEDKDFKPKMICALKEINSMLNTEIDSIIIVLKKSNNKKYSEVFSQILPQGKKMFKKYLIAFDSLNYGQQRFDEENKYILKRNIVRRSF